LKYPGWLKIDHLSGAFKHVAILSARFFSSHVHSAIHMQGFASDVAAL
jgi:hypothetical protein